MNKAIPYGTAFFMYGLLKCPVAAPQNLSLPLEGKVSPKATDEV